MDSAQVLETDSRGFVVSVYHFPGGCSIRFAISQQHEEPVTAVAAIGFCVCSGFTSCLRRGQTFLKINTDGFLPSGFTLPTSLVDSESTFCRRLLLLLEFPSSSFDGCREGIIETKADRLRAEAACDE